MVIKKYCECSISNPFVVVAYLPYKTYYKGGKGGEAPPQWNPSKGPVGREGKGGFAPPLQWNPSKGPVGREGKGASPPPFNETLVKVLLVGRVRGASPPSKGPVGMEGNGGLRPPSIKTLIFMI